MFEVVAFTTKGETTAEELVVFVGLFMILQLVLLFEGLGANHALIRFRLILKFIYCCKPYMGLNMREQFELAIECFPTLRVKTLVKFEANTVNN